MKKAPKLSSSERSEIEILHGKGYSSRAIARVLGRSPNTIATELKRNSLGGDGRTAAGKRGTYNARAAKQKAYVRRKYAKYQGKKIQDNDELRSYIVAALVAGWNPDEMSGAMKREKRPFYASKTTIYKWLYSAWGQAYCQYLPSRQYRPKKRKATKAVRVMIPDRVSITERPPEVDARQAPGHLEYDSVVSSKRSGSTYALVVVQERATRLVRAQLVPNLRPVPYARVVVGLTKDMSLRTMTTDNGIENRAHRDITEATGTPVFFTDPDSSWQKGGVENANRMLRKYFPKGTDFSRVKQTDVVNAAARINNKPRKILGYKSALQVAKEKGVLRDTGVLIGG